MTIINQLIKDAKGGAKELLLPENHIGSVAQHMCDTTSFGLPLRLQRDEAEQMLRRGTVKMCGVPVRVTPKQPVT